MSRTARNCARKPLPSLLYVGTPSNWPLEAAGMEVVIGEPSALAAMSLYQIRTGRGLAMNLFTRVGLALPNTCQLRSHTPFSIASGSGVTTMKKLGWQPGSPAVAPMDVSTSVRRSNTRSPASRGRPAMKGQIGRCQSCTGSSMDVAVPATARITPSQRHPPWRESPPATDAGGRRNHTRGAGDPGEPDPA